LRLIQFHVPGCNEFYNRFSLHLPLYYPEPSRHPILAICNSSSKIFFWDLDRLLVYQDYSKAHTASDGTVTSSITTYPNLPKRPNWLIPSRPRKSQHSPGKKDILGRLRDLSPPESVASSQRTGSIEPFNGSETAASQEQWERRYSIGDPQRGGSRVSRSDEAQNFNTATNGKKKGNNRVEELVGVEAHRVEVVPKYVMQGRQVAWSVGGEWCVVVGTPNIVAVYWRWGGLDPSR